jgi:hypothetical protein
MRYLAISRIISPGISIDPTVTNPSQSFGGSIGKKGPISYLFNLYKDCSVFGNGICENGICENDISGN